MFAISHRNREPWPPRSEIPEFKPTQKKISKAKGTDSFRKRDLIAGITKKKRAYNYNGSLHFLRFLTENENSSVQDLTFPTIHKKNPTFKQLRTLIPLEHKISSYRNNKKKFLVTMSADYIV